MAWFKHLLSDSTQTWVPYGRKLNYLLIWTFRYFVCRIFPLCWCFHCLWSICSGRYNIICTVALQLDTRRFVLSTIKKYKWNQYHRKRVQKLWEERLKIEEYNKKFLEDNEKLIPTDKKTLFRQDEFYYSDLDNAT